MRPEYKLVHKPKYLIVCQLCCLNVAALVWVRLNIFIKLWNQCSYDHTLIINKKREKYSINYIGCVCVCLWERGSFVPVQSRTSHIHQTWADWAGSLGICAECISSWQRARPTIHPWPKCWFGCCPGQPGSLPFWGKQRKNFEKQSVPNLPLTQRPIYSVTGQGRL